MELRIKNRAEEKQRVHEALQSFSAAHGVPARAALAMELALEEWITNVQSYGFEAASESEIAITFWADNSEIQVFIEDSGRPFDPLLYAAPDLARSLDAKPIGGLGIHMIRKSLDEIRYARVAGKNQVSFIKRFAAPESLEPKLHH